MSQGAISVSGAHPDVSSTSVRIGRRRFVTNVSPTAAASFMNHARLASIDIHSVRSRALNAQASTTWVPWVFTTLMRCPAPTRAALPRRAGIVTSSGLTGPPFFRRSSAGFAGATRFWGWLGGGHLGPLRSKPVSPAVVRGLRRDPAGAELRARLPDLHGEGAAGREGIARVGPPHLHRKGAVGAHRDGAEGVDLRAGLDEGPRLRRARLDPVAAVGGEARDLEDVEHVVHVELGKGVRRGRGHEGTVAAEVGSLAVVGELVHGGIAAGAEQGGAATAVAIPALPESGARDRQHRPEVRQARPEPVE